MLFTSVLNSFHVLAINNKSTFTHSSFSTITALPVTSLGLAIINRSVVIFHCRLGRLIGQQSVVPRPEPRNEDDPEDGEEAGQEHEEVGVVLAHEEGVAVSEFGAFLE